MPPPSRWSGRLCSDVVRLRVPVGLVRAGGWGWPPARGVGPSLREPPRPDANFITLRRPTCRALRGHGLRRAPGGSRCPPVGSGLGPQLPSPSPPATPGERSSGFARRFDGLSPDTFFIGYTVASHSAKPATRARGRGCAIPARYASASPPRRCFVATAAHCSSCRPREFFKLTSQMT